MDTQGSGTTTVGTVTADKPARTPASQDQLSYLQIATAPSAGESHGCCLVGDPDKMRPIKRRTHR